MTEQQLKDSAERLKPLMGNLMEMQKESNKILNESCTPELMANLPDDIKKLFDEGRSAMNVRPDQNGTIDFSGGAKNAFDKWNEINAAIKNNTNKK